LETSFDLIKSCACFRSRPRASLATCRGGADVRIPTGVGRGRVTSAARLISETRLLDAARELVVNAVHAARPSSTGAPLPSATPSFRTSGRPPLRSASRCS
jgi:hypothetical protein